MVDESMLKLFANYLHNPLQPQYLLTFLQLQLRALISSIFRFVIPPQLVGCQVLNACCNYFCGISTLSTTATKFLSFSPTFQVLRIPPSKTIGCQIVSWMHAATICGLSTESPSFVMRHFVFGPWKLKLRDHLRQEAFRPCPSAILSACPRQVYIWVCGFGKGWKRLSFVASSLFLVNE